MNSVNHHYVPQLYLKGFTSENGRLQVFDKARMQFKKDRQTPKTIFFEKHRNTISFKGVQTDMIEKLYGSLEAQFGGFFDHVRKGISHDELISKDGIYLMKLFLATQFWRMPLLDDFADEYLQGLDLNRFGHAITIGGVPLGETEEVKFLLKADKGFRHYFRSFVLPLLMFDMRVHESDYHCWRLHTLAENEANWDNLLTSDNPFIVEDVAKIFTFNAKLFFPLSKTQLVTYSPTGNNHREFPAVFSTKLAMVMNSQSKKYLVGANREYMEKVLELQDQVYGADGVPRLRCELFEYI